MVKAKYALMKFYAKFPRARNISSSMQISWETNAYSFFFPLILYA